MKIYLHQTHHTIADFSSTFSYLKNLLRNAEKGVHLFPECFLNGHPCLDLCLQPSYIDCYQRKLEELGEFCRQQERDDEGLFLFGGLEYQRNGASSIPEKIFNALYSVSPGLTPQVTYRKQLLPSYDIFDESKYFTPGAENKILNFMDRRIGLLICEDMWGTSAHQGQDPVLAWLQQGENLDLIVNISASPFHLNKADARIRRAREISHALQAPLIYVNRVGGEDEILFDGGSFVANGDQILAQCPSFQAAQNSLTLPKYPGKYPEKSRPMAIHTNAGPWEDIFVADLQKENPLRLRPWSLQQLEKAIRAIQFGIQEYASKNGFQKFLVALSGGIDSALVLTLAKLGLLPGQSIEALFMPGLFSAPISSELSQELCQNLGISLRTLPIKFLHTTCRNAFLSTLYAPLEGLADENIQGRLRSTLLYARSNQTDAMVLNTSNKSELSVGYCTLYGDSVGAIAPLGDCYKSEIYQLAEYLNQHHGAIIPQGIIDRPPSAELRAGQQDSDSLPEYPVLDAILEGLLSYSMDRESLIQLGHSPEDVERITQRYSKAEYKRAQFCPIIKIKSKSYGFGHRVPISKNSQYYFTK